MLYEVITELGDAVNDEEASEALIPPKETFAPATEPLKPLTGVAAKPAEQTASTAPSRVTVN